LSVALSTNQPSPSATRPNLVSRGTISGTAIVGGGYSRSRYAIPCARHADRGPERDGAGRAARGARAGGRREARSSRLRGGRAARRRRGGVLPGRGIRGGGRAGRGRLGRCGRRREGAEAERGRGRPPAR